MSQTVITENDRSIQQLSPLLDAQNQWYPLLAWTFGCSHPTRADMRPIGQSYNDQGFYCEGAFGVLMNVCCFFFGEKTRRKLQPIAMTPIRFQKRLNFAHMWQEIDNKLIWEYQFESFAAAFSFLNEVAALAAQFNHHPTISQRIHPRSA